MSFFDAFPEPSRFVQLEIPLSEGKLFTEQHLLVQVTIVRSEIPSLLVIVAAFFASSADPVSILVTSLVLIALALPTPTAP